jgi:hypothetical protein
MYDLFSWVKWKVQPEKIEKNTGWHLGFAFGFVFTLYTLHFGFTLWYSTFYFLINRNNNQDTLANNPAYMIMDRRVLSYGTYARGVRRKYETKMESVAWENRKKIHVDTLTLPLHFTLYTLHFTLYTLHFTLYTLHSTLYTLHFTLYTLHFTLYMYFLFLRFFFWTNINL